MLAVVFGLGHNGRQFMLPIKDLTSGNYKLLLPEM